MDPRFWDLRMIITSVILAAGALIFVAAYVLEAREAGHLARDVGVALLALAGVAVAYCFVRSRRET